MAKRMKRTQILFPEEQYRLLQREAAERKASIGTLVREAVSRHYAGYSQGARREAARRIVAMKLPVSDWDEMEREIERGMVNGCGEGG